MMQMVSTCIHYTRTPHISSNHSTWYLWVRLRTTVKKWLIDHIGQVFDKYEFIEVFASTYKLSATLENAKKGFEVAGLHPWNPLQANTKKLAPASLYKPEDPLPEVAADNSMVEEPQPSTSTNNEVPHRSPTPADVAPAEMFIKEPMIIKIGAKKFHLVEEAKEDTVEGKEDTRCTEDQVKNGWGSSIRIASMCVKPEVS